MRENARASRERRRAEFSASLFTKYPTHQCPTRNELTCAYPKSVLVHSWRQLKRKIGQQQIALLIR